MKVLLIAGNFVREQRLLGILLLFYALSSAVLFGYGEARVSTEDVSAFVEQQAIYAVLFSLFSGAWAIQNERKTRRIIAVLSKAVTRRQYIAGLLTGISAIFVAYCVAIGVGGTWLMRHSLWRPLELWTLLGCTIIAALLAAAVSVFYSTLLPPIVAMAATGITLGLPAALEQVLGSGSADLIPVYVLVRAVAKTSLRAPRVVAWHTIAIAVLEILLLWTAAAWIFGRKDVTVAAE
jgi:ABC-type transport system involved in multi-copper enzyme maturation permease subunit